MSFFIAFEGRPLTGESMIFDTLKYVKLMREVGFDDKQSEAMINVWSSVVRDQFVTKQDLKQALLEERLISNKEFEKVYIRFEKIEAKLRKLSEQIDLNLKNLENRMTLKLGGIMVGVIGASKIIESIF